METPQFDLVNPTPEEQADFLKAFQELCESKEMYFEPVPQFSRDTLQSPWKVTTQILLQKKVKKEGDKSIPSPFTNEPEKKD